MLSKMSKVFELTEFKKLFANSKGFRAKRQRIYYFNLKLKGELKNYEYLPDFLLTRPIKPYHFSTILISCSSPFKSTQAGLSRDLLYTAFFSQALE